VREGEREGGGEVRKEGEVMISDGGTGGWESKGDGYKEGRCRIKGCDKGGRGNDMKYKTRG
jgi:hypothetical protein